MGDTKAEKATAPSGPKLVIQPDAEPYFAAAAEGKLMIKRCGACGDAFFYPRSFCPFCGSADTSWLEASGRGVIYSYTVSYRRGVAFSAPAHVTLEEGPTVLAAIEGVDFDKIAVGQQVVATFQPATESLPPVLMFRPA